MIRFSSLVKKEKTFLVFLLSSPGIWWLLTRLPDLVTEWSKFPYYVSQKLATIFSEEKLVSIGLMRWAYIDSGKFMSLFSKVIYNRSAVFIDELFNFLGYISPRIYFNAGDGSKFSPPGVEPIAVFLFPFFLYGLFFSIKKSYVAQILYFLAFAFLAYIAGVRNMAFLFPVMLFYLWFARIGFNSVRIKGKNIFLLFIFVYGLFLSGRVLWTVFGKY